MNTKDKDAHEELLTHLYLASNSKLRPDEVMSVTSKELGLLKLQCCKLLDINPPTNENLDVLDVVFDEYSQSLTSTRKTMSLVKKLQNEINSTLNYSTEIISRLSRTFK